MSSPEGDDQAVSKMIGYKENSMLTSVQSPPPPGNAPYPPRYLGLGGRPSVMPDIPITSAFLFVYFIFATIHFVIMKYNEHRGHKFNFSGALFGMLTSFGVEWSSPFANHY